jgi:hypothetical protein
MRKHLDLSFREWPNLAHARNIFDDFVSAFVGSVAEHGHRIMSAIMFNTVCLDVFPLLCTSLMVIS